MKVSSLASAFRDLGYLVLGKRIQPLKCCNALQFHNLVIHQAFSLPTMGNTFSDRIQIGTVSIFSELVNTDFVGERNALCCYRNWRGDFKEIVDQLQLKENRTEVDPEELLALQLSEKGNLAREFDFSDKWRKRPKDFLR